MRPTNRNLNGTLNCPSGTKIGSYCGGDSNSTGFIIHCFNDGLSDLSAYLSDCQIALVGMEPVGIKLGAVWASPQRERLNKRKTSETNAYDIAIHLEMIRTKYILSIQEFSPVSPPDRSEQSKESGDAVCVYDGREFDTKPYGSKSVTTTGGSGTENPGSLPTVPVNEVAEYIMEVIRQNGSN
ncbi:hypothetical protein AA313_de0207149 [Arthrobotrys entomopaga]|nr:hypothetical protein AA313_de0207149 [Arthrobotrys entomopaga]